VIVCLGDIAIFGFAKIVQWSDEPTFGNLDTSNSLGLFFNSQSNMAESLVLKYFILKPVDEGLKSPVSKTRALRRAHTQRFQSADSGLDGCFQQKQSVIGSVGSSTSPDLPISYT
jgi:hypothetical protein